jgi:hypothetical protein
LALLSVKIVALFSQEARKVNKVFMIAMGANRDRPRFFLGSFPSPLKTREINNWDVVYLPSAETFVFMQWKLNNLSIRFVGEP